MKTLSFIFVNEKMIANKNAKITIKSKVNNNSRKRFNLNL